MAENRQYDYEYKVQAVKLAKEIGQAKAAKELGIPKNTLYGWVRANRLGNLDLGAGSQSPQSAMTLNQELIRLRQQVKQLEKENRRLKKENDFLEEASAFFAASRLKSFFRCEPSEVSKNERMKFIALKTKDGESKGEIAFCCRTLHVSRQGFYQYLANKNRPWKYQPLADAMLEILSEDECNDTYGRIRMYQALTLRQPENVEIPSERTVYRIMKEIGINRDQPSSQTQTERNHKSGQGSQKIR